MVSEEECQHQRKGRCPECEFDGEYDLFDDDGIWREKYLDDDMCNCFCHDHFDSIFQETCVRCDCYGK